jgi:hypothetical protein
MFTLLILAAIVLTVGLSSSVVAQDASQRTRDLVAALDKTKYKKKEKANIAVEVFVDIKNEPAVKDAYEYGGIYEAEGYRLLLYVDKSGAAKGSGYDTFGDLQERSNFELKDARVDGALLTGTKVFDNGVELPFEAVFINRTSRAGTNPKAVTTETTQFGLGFIQNGDVGLGQCDENKAVKPNDKNSTLADIANKNPGWTNRVFLQRN